MPTVAGQGMAHLIPELMHVSTQEKSREIGRMKVKLKAKLFLCMP
jgi:hypothetical protein